MSRPIKVGDAVTVIGPYYNERIGQSGTVVGVSLLTADDWPILVEFLDYGRWPFGETELQNDTRDLEEDDLIEAGIEEAERRIAGEL